MPFALGPKIAPGIIIEMRIPEEYMADVNSDVLRLRQ